MALDFRTVDVKFTQGTDGKTQSKLVVPGKWLALSNMSLSDEYTPKTRDGHGLLDGGTTGNGLATFNNELISIAGTGVKTWSPNGNASVSVSGAYSDIGIAKSEVFRSTGFQDSVDCAGGSGLVAYVWRDMTGGTVNGIKCTIIDNTSGAAVLGVTQLLSSANAATPRVVFANNAFFFIYRDGTANIYCNVVTAAAPSTVGGAVAVVAGAGNLASKNIDACASVDGVKAFVVYGWTAGADSLRAIEISRAGTVPAVFAGPLQVCAAATFASANIQGVACASFGNGTHIGVFFATGVALSFLAGTVVNDSTFAVVGGAGTVIDAITMPVNSATHVVAISAANGSLTVIADQQSSFGTADFRPVRAVTVPTTLIASAGPATVANSACFRINAAEASGPQGPFIAGKPFLGYSGGIYLPMCILENYNQSTLNANTSTTSAQNSFVLMTVNMGTLTATPVGHALYGTLGLYDSTMGGAAPLVSTPCSTADPTGTGIAYVTAQLERLTLQTVQGINITPTGICRLTLQRYDTVGPIHAQLGQNLFLSGGMLQTYDGKQIVEHGFLLYPEGISVVVTAAGAGSVTVGTHQLVATYEWTDAQGLRHQSAPSPSVSFTFANATDQADVIVPTLLVSQKSNVTISLWMTEAGGSTFYRVVNSFTTTMANSTSASTVSFTGASAIGRGVVATDARIRQGEILYSEPTKSTDTLPNIVPPPTQYVREHQNRLVLLAGDDPGAYWLSQQLAPNTGLMFNSAIKGRLPSEGGDSVAVASLDEKIIFFCSRRIYVVYGTGPKPDGTYSSYSDPQDIQSDVGCSDARSILAELPGGIMFKSQKGWYMLERDLSTKYIGEGAAAYDSYTVQSAVLVGNKQQARFVINDSSSRRTTLVYSYQVDSWSVYKSGNNYAPADATWWPSDNSGSGGYVTIANSLGINHDISGQQYDSEGGNSVVFTIGGTSSWLHLGALEAFQRVRRFYLTGTDLAGLNSTLALTFNFDDGTAQTYSVSISTSGVLVSNAPFDIRHKMQIQKCKSMQLVFLETPASTVATRMTGIQAMALEVGMRRGVNKLPAAQSVG